MLDRAPTRARAHHELVALKALISISLLLFVGACSSAKSAQSTHGRVIRVTESNNGKTVTAHAGDELDVVLSNTYWTIQPPTSSIVKAKGSSQVQPQLQGCIPGGGCGTVTQRFVAAKPGTVTITAGRAVCGEALRCTGQNGRYKVTVKVR